MSDSGCPCGSGESWAACCGPIVNGERSAVTALELMRARYSAHTRGEIDFIVATHDPASRADIDIDATLEWARESEWLGLDIRDVETGEARDSRGEVEFVAHYREDGERRIHHERAQFARDADGAWMYVGGGVPDAVPVRRSGPRTGRNDPCPCGSGRKYKKCCA